MNSLRQGAISVGEGYLNRAWSVYIHFDSADPITHTASVSVFDCVPAPPIISAPAVVLLDGDCSRGERALSMTLATDVRPRCDSTSLDPTARLGHVCAAGH